MLDLQIHRQTINSMSIVFQVLEETGLNKYVDARYIQQELQEATDMTQEQMDQAARDLLRRTSVPGDPQGKMPYYDHLGGYSMQEMKDYNQYSQRDDLIPRGNPRGGGGRNYPDEFSEEDDEMMYVTTL